MQFTELVYIAYAEGEIRVIMFRGVFCISTIFSCLHVAHKLYCVM